MILAFFLSAKAWHCIGNGVVLFSSYILLKEQYIKVVNDNPTQLYTKQVIYTLA